MTAVYLYCIVKSARQPSATKAPRGLPGASVPALLRVSRALWLVVADAPLKTYGPGNLEQHLADMDWVGRIALAHEEVVEHFARKAMTTLIPMKLFTMFSSRARATADVGSRKAGIDASMRRISGAEEWGIRVLSGPVERPAARVTPRPASGTAFLAAKKRARDDTRSATLAAAAAASQVYERLSKLARDSTRRDRAPAEGTIPPLLDAAFLVPTAKRSRFTQTARREAAACAKAGARVTLSGPWPAYNFVQIDEQTA